MIDQEGSIVSVKENVLQELANFVDEIHLLRSEEIETCARECMTTSEKVEFFLHPKTFNYDRIQHAEACICYTKRYLDKLINIHESIDELIAKHNRSLSSKVINRMVIFRDTVWAKIEQLHLGGF